MATVRRRNQGGGKRAAGRAHCPSARGRRRRCRSGYRPPEPPCSRTSSWCEARGTSYPGRQTSAVTSGAVKGAGRPYSGGGPTQCTRGQRTASSRPFLFSCSVRTFRKRRPETWMERTRIRRATVVWRGGDIFAPTGMRE
eukprot:scaffold27084_cov55-Phaeocystis_antarctica.AAC.4